MGCYWGGELFQIIMAESKMVESIDWSKIVHTVAIGAAIAGLGYLTVQYYRLVE